MAWLSLFCITASIIGCGYALGAAWTAARFARRSTIAEPREWPDVSILKPLAGAEVQLVENLASFILQDYPGRVQIVFGVQSPHDPALLAVEEVRRRHPAADMEIVVDGAEHGSNRKVSNLVNMAGAIRHPVVVLADSDVLVDPHYLRSTVAALLQPGVGLATCLFRGAAQGGVSSRLAAMAINDHFLPSVVLGVATGLATPCMGPTIALSRETLARIGGFEAFANQLADDYAIGAAVRRTGEGLAIPQQLITHVCADSSLAAMIGHELRWARTVAIIDPAGFAGSIVTHALPLALLGAALRGFDAAGVGAIAAALGCRLWLKFRLAREFELPNPEYWLTPLRDMLSFAVYLGSFATRRVSWRGHDYLVHKDGSMAATPAGKRGKTT